MWQQACPQLQPHHTRPCRGLQAAAEPCLAGLAWLGLGSIHACVHAGHAAGLPWYDVRFVGYAMNKIVQVYTLQHMGYRFSVHPGAWLVHLPHAQTRIAAAVRAETRAVLRGGKSGLAQTALLTVLRSMYKDALQRMRMQAYVPQIDPGFAALWDQLPWLVQARPPAGPAPGLYPSRNSTAARGGGSGVGAAVGAEWDAVGAAAAALGAGEEMSSREEVWAAHSQQGAGAEGAGGDG